MKRLELGRKDSLETSSRMVERTEKKDESTQQQSFLFYFFIFSSVKKTIIIVFNMIINSSSLLFRSFDVLLSVRREENIPELETLGST